MAHGTTAVTNAIVEGRIATVGLVTTRGFRDVLAIGRQNRANLYELILPGPPFSLYGTLTLARFVALATGTLAFLASLRDLDTPLFLGGGSPDTLTLSVLIFTFWSESRLGESAALTVLLLLLTVAVFLPVYRRFPRAF